MSDMECIHGMTSAWCSICREIDGYLPGSNRQRNDCTVIAFANLTGADYAEAEKITADHGRRPGKGMTRDALHAALESIGFKAMPCSLNIDQAVRLSRSSGRTFHVSARRRDKGHSWAIINGEQPNGWTASGGSFRYSIFEIK
jgi:hypothetical protein